jgi:hypothetical protein
MVKTLLNIPEWGGWAGYRLYKPDFALKKKVIRMPLNLKQGEIWTNQDNPIPVYLQMIMEKRKTEKAEFKDYKVTLGRGRMTFKMILQQDGLVCKSFEEAHHLVIDQGLRTLTVLSGEALFWMHSIQQIRWR